MSYDGLQLRRYVNGTTRASLQIRGTLPSAELPFPGWASRTSSSVRSDCFQGSIDQVRLWKTVRSPAEIAAARDRTPSPATPGLIGYWRFDEPAGSQSIIDLTTPSPHPGALGADSRSAADDPTRAPR